MAVDMFLLVEGIDGESKDDVYKDKIDILAWSWGASQSGTMHTGGGGTGGKANVQDLSVTKYIDSASNLLLQHVLDGKHIPTVELVVRKAGGTPLDYLKIKLTKVIVSSLSTGGSGGEDRLTENVTLNFEQVDYTYVPQEDDGSGGADKLAGWNIANVKSTV